MSVWIALCKYHEANKEKYWRHTVKVFLTYGAPGIKSSSAVTGLFNTVEVQKLIFNKNIPLEFPIINKTQCRDTSFWPHFAFMLSVLADLLETSKRTKEKPAE